MIAPLGKIALTATATVETVISACLRRVIDMTGLAHLMLESQQQQRKHALLARMSLAADCENFCSCVPLPPSPLPRTAADAAAAAAAYTRRKYPSPPALARTAPD